MDLAQQALIAVLDAAMPDPDTELNGDETDHCNSKDCFIDHGFFGSGPGCPIADPDYGGEEAGEPDEGI